MKLIIEVKERLVRSSIGFSVAIRKESLAVFLFKPLTSLLMHLLYNLIAKISTSELRTPIIH